LKDHRRISANTRARVKEAARKVGYVPDPRLASAMSIMKKKRVDTPVAGLGYITSFTGDWNLEEHPIYYNYYRGAKAQALEMGYRLENYNLKLEGLSGKRLRTILRSRGVEGIVVAPLFDIKERLDIEFSDLSAVTFGYSLVNDGINRVSIDQYASVLRALEKIREKGYKRIGFVADPDSNKRFQYRWEAALLAFQVKFPDQEPVTYTEGTDRQKFMEWFNHEKPDALLCHGLLWTGFLEEEAGLLCGDDYGFATYAHECLEMQRALLGNQRVADRLKNASGMDQGSFNTGRIAVELLARDIMLNLKGLNSDPRTTLVDAHWVDGDTL
jgi:LacI family transcriptional regulator